MRCGVVITDNVLHDGGREGQGLWFLPHKTLLEKVYHT